jgi:hypothetical protein
MQSSVTSMSVYMAPLCSTSVWTLTIGTLLMPACLTFGRSASRLPPKLKEWWRTGNCRLTGVRSHGKSEAHMGVGLESGQGEEEGTTAGQKYSDHLSIKPDENNTSIEISQNDRYGIQPEKNKTEETQNWRALTCAIGGWKVSRAERAPHHQDWLRRDVSRLSGKGSDTTGSSHYHRQVQVTVVRRPTGTAYNFDRLSLWLPSKPAARAIPGTVFPTLNFNVNYIMRSYRAMTVATTGRVLSSSKQLTGSGQRFPLSVCHFVRHTHT